MNVLVAKGVDNHILYIYVESSTPNYYYHIGNYFNEDACRLWGSSDYTKIEPGFKLKRRPLHIQNFELEHVDSVGRDPRYYLNIKNISEYPELYNKLIIELL